jgi:hypothetical protein
VAIPERRIPAGRSRQERTSRVFNLLNTVGLILYTERDEKSEPFIEGFEVREEGEVHGYYARDDMAVHVQANPSRAGKEKFWLIIGKPTSRASTLLQRSQSIREDNEESLMRERSGEPRRVSYSPSLIADMVTEALTPNKQA